MFRNTIPDTEPAPNVVASAPSDPVPISVLSLDLDEPVGGWTAYLTGRGIPIVSDDIGRQAVSRDDAKQLFDERREAEVRKREMLAQQELRAELADREWRSQLPVGLPWYEIPDGVPPVVAMTQAARDEAPRKRSMVEDLLDRRDTMVFHPMQGEEAS